MSGARSSCGGGAPRAASPTSASTGRVAAAAARHPGRPAKPRPRGYDAQSVVVGVTIALCGAPSQREVISFAGRERPCPHAVSNRSMNCRLDRGELDRRGLPREKVRHTSVLLPRGHQGRSWQTAPSERRLIVLNAWETVRDHQLVPPNSSAGPCPGCVKAVTATRRMTAAALMRATRAQSVRTAPTGPGAEPRAMPLGRAVRRGALAGRRHQRAL